MKCLLRYLLVLALLILAQGTAYAVNPPEIYTPDLTAAAGETVDIPISLRGNPGIASMKLSVQFDSEAFTLSGAVIGQTFLDTPGAQHNESIGTGRATLNWLCITGEHSGDEIFATLRFLVRDSAVNGIYPIYVAYNKYDVFDQDLNSVSFAIQEGTLRVTGGKEPTETGAGSDDTTLDVAVPDSGGSTASEPNIAAPASSAVVVPDTGNGTASRLSSEFSDVRDTDWFHDDVIAMREKGYVQGVSETEFAPKETMNRAMVVQILYRMSGTPKPDSAREFSDVARPAWYHDAVSWAALNEIVLGNGNGQFGPNDPVTREQFSAFLYRYAKYRGMNADTGADLSSYTDSAQIHAWASESMQWANGAGIIRGRTETELSPNATATRAEAVVILNRFLRLLDQAGTDAE